MEKKRKFTVSEAAVVLDVNPRTVYRMIERGELDALKPGQSYTITRSHLREYVGSEEALEDLEASVDLDEA
jgi:excisionase family DNA binding protein